MRTSSPSSLRRRHRVVVASLSTAVVLVTLAVPGPAVAKVMEGSGPPADGASMHPLACEPTGPPAHPSASDARPSASTAQPSATVDRNEIVLDPARGLPDGWEPDDLVALPALGTHTDDGMVSGVILDDLLAMHTAASAAGAPFDVVSGYRSSQRQARIQAESQQAEDARTAWAAPRMVAPPDHSEHQLGTTIDVIDPSEVSLTPAFADTPAGGWIAEHAPEFGFVVSYPKGWEAVTCYGWEPWHLRHVGRDLAQQVDESGLALRAFLLLRAQ